MSADVNNIGVIEKIRIDSNSMYIQVKLDASQDNQNIFYFDDNYYLVDKFKEFEVNKNEFYDICKEAKIHKLKCEFKVYKESKIKEILITAIDGIFEAIYENPDETKNIIEKIKEKFLTIGGMPEDIKNVLSITDNIPKITDQIHDDIKQALKTFKKTCENNDNKDNSIVKISSITLL